MMAYVVSATVIAAAMRCGVFALSCEKVATLLPEIKSIC